MEPAWHAKTDQLRSGGWMVQGFQLAQTATHLHLDDARGEVGHGVARGGRALAHLAEDVRAPRVRRLERATHDLQRDALHLDVHLESRDALLCLCTQPTDPAGFRNSSSPYGADSCCPPTPAFRCLGGASSAALRWQVAAA